MTKDQLICELQRLKMLIDWEEAADRGYDHKAVRVLWQKYHTLKAQLKSLENNDKK